MNDKELLDIIKNSFRLDENNELYRMVLGPKSKRNELFNTLSKIGEILIDFSLLQKFDNLLDTGILTTMSNKFHTKECLVRLGYHIRLERHITKKWNLSLLTAREIKEVINALLGVSYQIHGLLVVQEIVSEMVDAIEKYNLYENNPKGMLMDLHTKNNYPTPTFKPLRVSSSDHKPVWKCVIKDDFFGTKKDHISDPFLQQIEAENDASQKFLFALGKVECPSFICFDKTKEK
ncbi:MAG: hypothetical protein FK733_04660 [Asgard group archaeon]|nr:hypothetical protein [Asgard group archaeon]